MGWNREMDEANFRVVVGLEEAGDYQSRGVGGWHCFDTFLMISKVVMKLVC